MGDRTEFDHNKALCKGHCVDGLKGYSSFKREDTEFPVDSCKRDPERDSKALAKKPRNQGLPKAPVDERPRDSPIKSSAE